MEYKGQELEIFDKATIWRKYVHNLIKYYFKDNLLEVGAGIGSFTSNYFKSFANVVLSELDEKNIQILSKKFSQNNNIIIQKKDIRNLESKFNTIMYLNVLEHIENDLGEINFALKKIKLWRTFNYFSSRPSKTF